ncbi:TonB-dependent siderophore receptor [Asticcacaulis sp. AND118]|uniref:TonB-dependent receptor plug domain-containing protein n=1 Tax=Asticcacaulis sp. AND118 TaxID=2840468 RepID=UPI001CFFCCBB|nr:TonB-dependent receptor [Asticcacaulis sp. AND118]UDF02495.1 TonB-dependent receptor [Asticcacaulis sp. AND118]
MSTFKHRTLAAALTATTALTLISFPAFAQDASAEDDVTEVVVTGSRAQPRSRLDTLAPVDVIRKDALDAQGSTELAQTLSRAAPSLTFPRPSAVDGTDSVRPASLRGLSPDQTLVLVNGKRRHSSAQVNTNGSTGRGSSAVDLNAIPTAGLSNVEILRDGASAQYGSDAIAGVVNLRLREARSGGSLSASYGQYNTEVEAARSSRKENDGSTYNVAGWIGLPLGSDGFLTVSGEYRNRESTNRADVDPRVTPNRVTGRYGDPEQESLALFANAGKPLQNGWELYGFASFQDLESESAAFFRTATNANNHQGLYPNGFLPLISVKSKDYSATAGTRGQWGDWTSDYSLTWGRNELDYNTLNSVNGSLTSGSKTSFYDGTVTYDQLVFNADISREFAISLYSPLTVAIGVEARHENYQIEAGELQSYQAGPLLGQTDINPGAQGFIGFRPSNAVDVNRDNVGLYTEISADITPRLSFAAAARAENYSDFGDNLSGKLSLRYELTDNLALRGSVSSGFRAPSLQQQYFTSTASVVSGGVVVETGTFPASSAVAKALGAPELEAEESTNFATGFVYRKGPFELTLDAYRINIDNRIVLTENISGTTEISNLLRPYGVSAARFFTNGVDSETTGIDLVANYRLPTDTYGRFNFNLAWNTGNTEITRLPGASTTSNLQNPPVLFARIRQYILTNSTPENKGSATVDWTGGKWAVNGRATYYGDVIDAAAASASDIHTGEKTLVDLSASYKLTAKTSVTVGADNVFDVYPDKTLASLQGSQGALAFTRFSPFGFNGRYVYARLTHNW